MIKMTIEYTCDVDGCESKDESGEVMGLGFGGIPKGWADVRWMMDSKPSASDPRNRFMRALKKVRTKLPPEMAEFQDAGANLFVGEAGPKTVSCRAVICGKCLDRINLGGFQADNNNVGVLG